MEVSRPPESGDVLLDKIRYYDREHQSMHEIST